jgi:hypothetical protein
VVPRDIQFNALSRYKFAALSARLQAPNTFIQWTEGLEANLGKALAKIMRLIDRFVEMERNRNECPGTCRAVFFQRILGRQDLVQLLLYFLIPPDGLDWYRRPPDECVAGFGFFSKQLVR